MIEVRMLGPLTVRRHDVTLQLPASRKVRALLAYLLLAENAVSRSRLCDFLWDAPSDPRGELRWCLSKIRGVVDEPGRQRVQSRADTIWIDLSGCFVDAIEVARAVENLDTLSLERLRTLDAYAANEFLESLTIDGAPAFDRWLAAQRRRFGDARAAIIDRLVHRLPDREALTVLEKWLEFAPFDYRVHERILDLLVRLDCIRDAEKHVASAARSFEAEGLDSGPIRAALRAARVRELGSSRFEIHAACLEQPDDVASSGAFRAESRRASVAVMPFSDRSEIVGIRGGAADALAHDIITRLAKLRSLFVIAQGTVFALHERSVDPHDAGRLLKVDYIVSGSVMRQGRRLEVRVDITDMRTGRVVWAEIFNQEFEDAFVVLDEIGNTIVATIASEIETVERNRAVLRPPNSLDAWEAHHRGLWHMYRFNKADNERAQHFFSMAVHLDPTFARAHAGLSFTHFQNAFQGWAPRELEVDRAYAAAGESVMSDERDPAAHWAIGRALWLRGLHAESVTELQQAVDLSPNFALAHYTLAFVHSQTGDPHAAIAFSDHSRQLSPFDPLLFGMLGARAMALVRIRQFDEAAQWGVKAATRPNAHAHIRAIAAFSLALAGRLDEAREHVAKIHEMLPGYRAEDFLTAMQFDADGQQLFREGAMLLDLA